MGRKPPAHGVTELSSISDQGLMDGRQLSDVNTRACLHSVRRRGLFGHKHTPCVHAATLQDAYLELVGDSHAIIDCSYL